MTSISHWRDSLLHAIEDAALLRRPRRVSRKDGAVVLVGRISVEGREAELVVNVEPLLRHQLPTFVLQPWDAFGFIPHIDSSGLICFLEHEGMVFDWRRPFDVIRECFDHIQRTLRAGVTRANLEDFVDEFEVYWQRLPDHKVALADLHLLDEVGEVVIGRSDNLNLPLRLAHTVDGLRQIAGLPGAHGPWMVSRAIYLPLEAGTLLVPPRSDQPFWSLDDARCLLEYCSLANRTQMTELLGKHVCSTEYVIVRLPRPSGGAALFGIQFDGVGAAHPLAEQGYAAQLIPVVIARRDRDYLVQRGGGHMELRNKRVLLLGCGAVGGHVAWELARAGLDDITLLDPDTLEPHNTYRHVLGRRYWGYKKAQALKQEIRANLPFAHIRAVTETIERALIVGSITFGAYDLIISAMGNPTTELALNEHVRSVQEGPPVLFTWLEPLGIGGHAVLTGMPGAGCYECLYTAPDDPAGALYNRAAFAAPNQTFHRSLAGCDTIHTPYGSLDAAQTAQLAVRLAIDVLTGCEQHNQLRSWKGHAETFCQHFELSSRYLVSADEFAQQEQSFSSLSCRICGESQDEQHR